MKLKPGDKVTYRAFGRIQERGIVKKVKEDSRQAFVVYKCGEDWDNYREYTAALTNFEDLSLSWGERKYYKLVNQSELIDQTVVLLEGETVEAAALEALEMLGYGIVERDIIAEGEDELCAT